MDSNDGLIFAYIIDGEGGGTAVDWQGISLKERPVSLKIYIRRATVPPSPRRN